jgi:serine/threonine protein kinase
VLAGSPEQANGKPVDRRADSWAFGCLLFEMLSGQRAFGRDTVIETLSAVMRDAPPFDLLPRECRHAYRVKAIEVTQVDDRGTEESRALSSSPDGRWIGSSDAGGFTAADR